MPTRLSPAKILNVQLDEETKEAKVGVLEDQLSLAIGKAGQNVRLAARLTGWKIDINGEKIESSESASQPASPDASQGGPVSESAEQASETPAEASAEEKPATEEVKE